MPTLVHVVNYSNTFEPAAISAARDVEDFTDLQEQTRCDDGHPERGCHSHEKVGEQALALDFWQAMIDRAHGLR